MVSVRIVCCVLCGAPLCSTVSGNRTEHQPPAGLHISIAHYPRGFGGYAERMRFQREVCRNCGETLMALLEPAIRWIHDREAGR
jgi:hypothetical protein